MLESDSTKTANNIRKLPMIEINETDVSNVSVLSQQLAITVLFSVLRRHDEALADDIASELAEAQRTLPNYMTGDVVSHVEEKLQLLQDMLLDKRPTRSDPVQTN